MRKSIPFVLVLLVASLLAGCSGSVGMDVYSVSGSIIDGNGDGIPGVIIIFGSDYGVAGPTGDNGIWRKDGLKGTVKVTVAKEGWIFSPAFLTVAHASSGEYLQFTGEEFSIQQLLDEAEDGATITIPPGIYYENLRIQGKFVELRSETPSNPNTVENTVIDGGSKGAVVRIEEGAKVKIDGLTLEGGIGKSTDGLAYGGGIYINGGVLELSNSIILENTAAYGGGIYVEDSVVVIHNNRFLKNRAINTKNSFYNDGGGIYEKNSSLELVSNHFEGNYTWGNGGVLYSEGGNHIMRANSVHNNTSRLGAGFYLIDGTHQIEENVFEKNDSDLGGGALYLSGGNHTITGNYMGGNRSAIMNFGEGGAMRIAGGTHTIAENVITANRAREGAALSITRGEHKLVNNLISHNSVYDYGQGGGAISVTNSSLELQNNEFVSNTGYDGGGIYAIQSSSLRMLNNVFEANKAMRNGGGIWLSATSTVVSPDGNVAIDPEEHNLFIRNTPDDVFRE